MDIWYYALLEAVRSVLSWLAMKPHVTSKMPHQSNVWLANSLDNFKKSANTCVYYWNLKQPPVASEGHNQIFFQKSINLSENQLIWTNCYGKYHSKWRFLMLGCTTSFWLLPQKLIDFKYGESYWSFFFFEQSIRPHRRLHSHDRPKDALILPYRPVNLTETPCRLLEAFLHRTYW